MLVLLAAVNEGLGSAFVGAPDPARLQEILGIPEAFVPIGVAMIGPGRYSLDWQFGLDFAFEPLVAFTISAVVGILSGVLLLVTCFRPPEEQS